MAYSVTFGNRPGPVAVHEEFDLDRALVHACRLLSEGHMDVAIQDGNGKRVSGDKLLACCEGKKKLTPDDFQAN